MYNRKTLRCADLFYHSYDDNEDERGHGGEGRHGGRGQRQLDYLKKAKNVFCSTNSRQNRYESAHLFSLVHKYYSLLFR